MTITNTHSLGVTQILFSPDGTLFATSDLGGKVCFWDTGSGNLLYDYNPGTSVLSLAWVDDADIICGLGDGTVVSLHLGEEEITMVGGWTHAYPVEHLSLFGEHLASGAHRELSVWRLSDWGAEGEPPSLEHEQDLFIIPDDPADEVLITGLHWTTMLGENDALVASTMNQGIYIFDSQDWSVVRRLGAHRVGVMATSSISPDGTQMVVSNLVYGFDIYNLQTSALVLTIPHNIGSGYPAPVMYIHGGRAVVSGTAMGRVTIWYLDGAICRKLQTLPIPGNRRVSSLTAFYDNAIDQFIIAAGMMTEDNDSPVMLWKAEDDQQQDARTSKALHGIHATHLFPAICNIHPSTVGLAIISFLVLLVVYLLTKGHASEFME